MILQARDRDQSSIRKRHEKDRELAHDFRVEVAIYFCSTTTQNNTSNKNIRQILGIQVFLSNTFTTFYWLLI